MEIPGTTQAPLEVAAAATPAVQAAAAADASVDAVPKPATESRHGDLVAVPFEEAWPFEEMHISEETLDQFEKDMAAHRALRDLDQKLFEEFLDAIDADFKILSRSSVESEDAGAATALTPSNELEAVPFIENADCPQWTAAHDDPVLIAASLFGELNEKQKGRILNAGYYTGHKRNSQLVDSSRRPVPVHKLVMRGTSDCLLYTYLGAFKLFFQVAFSAECDVPGKLWDNGFIKTIRNEIENAAKKGLAVAAAGAGAAAGGAGPDSAVSKPNAALAMVAKQAKLDHERSRQFAESTGAASAEAGAGAGFVESRGVTGIEEEKYRASTFANCCYHSFKHIHLRNARGASPASGWCKLVRKDNGRDLELTVEA